MTIRRFKQPFQEVLVAAEPARLPVVRVRLGLGSVFTHPLRAVVDTSVPWTLASLDVARRLGFDLASVQGSGDVIELPLTTPAVRAWGQPFDLVVGTGSGRRVLEDITVHITEAPLGPFALRLGQRDVLDQFVFTQREASFELEWED
jgi:hypothetical protein